MGSKIDLELADEIGQFYDDPLGFVLFAYDWANDPAIQLVKLEEPWASRYGEGWGPDAWACKILDEIGEQVRENNFDGHTPVKAIREGTSSGHGIGKSCLVAWLVNWIMSTRPLARGTVTANTAVQLQDKTWAEIAKWTKRSINAHWWDISTGQGSMRMVRKGMAETWFCRGQTCREENSESFAGQHSPTSTSFYIFDEASAIPDKIWEVAEGGLTDGEPMFFCFGNPTRNTGKFKHIFTKNRARWKQRQIDSREVKITNKAAIQEWIDDYGIDSDFVKVRVRGMFPSMSVKQFISEADVEAAFGRSIHISKYDFAPKILTCDPAWEGDDELVIGLRQGLAFQILKVIPKNDNDVVIANILSDLEDTHKGDAVFIDGGYGTGIISAARTFNRNHWRLVWFGSTDSPDEGCANMRAFMWKQMRDWLKEGGCIPEDQKLYDDLIGPELVGNMKGKIQLESKKDMKKRGLPSPGRADALAISFAYPVRAKTRRTYQPQKPNTWEPNRGLRA